ncbi:condensation domain-containing protein [Streptomyces sp. G-5]|uniref:condensation domain-containing protein n=1 Tax=Streptomyces sp. G-5 TaxID=2977231 RepID=UPI0021D3E145|nr:condensation domain-containing protein [Streptomyces sp. G-5]MCU4748110.1 condensation domain-containing protein [Streptomyces sp. G-5]
MSVSTPPSVSTPRTTWYGATPAQQGIWILDRIERLRPTYLIPSVLEFTGPVDHQALAGATRATLARYPALRSRFRLDTRHRRVEYRTDGPPAEVGFIDAVAEEWTAQELAALIEALCYTPFDLGTEAPARAEIIRTGTETTLLVLTVHHIVFDATSRELVLDEITGRYRAAVLGTPFTPRRAVHPDEVRPAAPAADLAERVSEAAARLRGAPTTVDLPYARDPHGDLPMLGGWQRTTLDAGTTERVTEAAAREGCTPFMTGVALLAGALARRGEQRDFLFAVVWPGRDDPASAEVVGMFMSTLILRVGLTATTTWRELLATARTAGMETFIDCDVPLDALAAELDADREVGRLPLSPVLVNMADSPGTIALAPGVRGRYRPLEPQYSKWDLALFVHLDEEDGERPRLGFSLDHPAALFDDAAINDLLTALRRGAADLAHDPEDLVLKPAAEDKVNDPAARLEMVRAVWCEVLGTDHVTDDISFFDAGGDSLRLVVLVERLREVSGRMVKTVDLFRAGTVRGQADLLATLGTTGDGNGGGGSARDRLLGAVRQQKAAGPQG